MTAAMADAPAPLPLAGVRVVEIAQNLAGPFAGEILATLGAEICAGNLGRDAVAAADFLVEGLGLERLAEQGVTRAALEAWNPALVHVSVTPFGSGNARSRSAAASARWRWRWLPACCCTGS